MNYLKDTHVMVIGASSGMGAATAKMISELGAHVILVGRNKERLEHVRKELSSKSTIIAADITHTADREKIINALPELDHIIFTAADLSYVPFNSFDQGAMDRAIGSKITGPFFLIQALASKIKDKGSVIFVSGVAAERPIPGGTVTGMVNGAINAMVRGLALELSPVRVNAVSPGWVDTPFWDRIGSQEQKTSRFNAMREKLPSHYITTPENIASAILSLITNPAVNASTMYVDSGQRLI